MARSRTINSSRCDDPEAIAFDNGNGAENFEPGCGFVENGFEINVGSACKTSTLAR